MNNIFQTPSEKLEGEYKQTQRYANGIYERDWHRIYRKWLKLNASFSHSGNNIFLTPTEQTKDLTIVLVCIFVLALVVYKIFWR
jgi:hypothetical protein